MLYTGRETRRCEREGWDVERRGRSGRGKCGTRRTEKQHGAAAGRRRGRREREREERRERHFGDRTKGARGYSGSARWKSGCFTDTQRTRWNSSLRRQQCDEIRTGGRESPWSRISIWEGGGEGESHGKRCHGGTSCALLPPSLMPSSEVTRKVPRRSSESLLGPDDRLNIRLWDESP